MTDITYRGYVATADGKVLPVVNPRENNEGNNEIKTMSAEEFEALTTEQKTALYNEGVRVIAVDGELDPDNMTDMQRFVDLYTIDAEGNSLPVIDNGALRKEETAVLALDSNKLGGKEPEYYLQPVNLLDNSNFQIAQAGYNGLHGTVYYIADRWVSANTSGEMTSNGLKITGSSVYSFMYQRVSGVKNKTLTFAVKFQNSPFANISINSSDINTQYAGAAGPNDDGLLLLSIEAPDDTLAFLIYPYLDGVGSGSGTIEWAALYEGSYTAETLPPYVPKGYAAELAECRLYYRPRTEIPLFAYTTGSLMGFSFEPMRNRPTIIGTVNHNYNPGASIGGDTSVVFYNKHTVACVDNANITEGTYYRFAAEFHADL